MYSTYEELYPYSKALRLKNGVMVEYVKAREKILPKTQFGPSMLMERVARVLRMCVELLAPFGAVRLILLCF